MSNNTLLSNYFAQIAKNPVPLVPYNPQTLNVLSNWVLGPSVGPDALFAAMALGGPQSSQGWTSVQPGLFNFPREHGPHWDIRNEWYYLACNLTYSANSQVNPLYLLLAIIRRGTNPANQNSQAQIVACEFTMELPGTTTPYITQSNAFDGYNSQITMQPPSATQDFQWSVNDDKHLFRLHTLASDAATSLNSFDVDVGFTHPTLGVVTCDLKLKSSCSPAFFLEGQNGCAPCIDGVGYRYYSWPALTVQTGTITVASSSYVVEGQAWLDHQWGSRMQPLGYVDSLYLRALGILGNSFPKELAPQWDWFFMHLSNGMHITTAVLPSKGYYGSGNPATSKSNLATLTNTTFITVDASGAMSNQTFQGGTVVYSKWVQANCNLYASAWQLDWADVTLSLVVTQPDNDAGFSKGVDGQSFMEKGVTVTGTVHGVKVTGTGFAEAVGYDPIERQVTELLTTMFGDLSTAQEYVSIFMPASASAGDIALASLLVIGPPVVLLIIIIIAIVIPLKNKAKKKKNSL